MRWEIEKLHRDVNPGMQDSSFLKRQRFQGYLLLFVIVVNGRDPIGFLKLRSVEELLRFVENGLGGCTGLMKMFKLR